MDASGVVDVVQAGGPWAGLLTVVLAGLRAIISGQLVPRGTLDILTQQWEARLREAAAQSEARLAESQHREDQWRTAYQNEAAAGDVRDAAITRLMAYAETADRVLNALPTKGGQ